MQNDINNQNILPVGTTLKNGQYRIVRHLKSGGFSNTYVVEDTSFHERSAMKEFFIHAKGVNTRSGKSVTVSNPVNEGDFLLYKRKFIHEIQRLRELHNRHVVRIYDDFEENNTAYYVMEFIDGESLSDRLSRTGRAMTEAEVTDVLRQMLNALTEVHGKGFVHADITPNNIMIDKSGNVVLIDFGSTKEVEGGNHRSTLAAMTRTPGYTPQEQLDGDVSRMGPWSDFYALGVTLFRLLTNESPLELKDKEEEAFAPYGDKISQPMRDLILWMTAHNRRKRPQTVAEILAFMKENFKDNQTTDVRKKQRRNTYKEGYVSNGQRQDDVDDKTDYEDTTVEENDGTVFNEDRIAEEEEINYKEKCIGKGDYVIKKLHKVIDWFAGDATQPQTSKPSIKHKTVSSTSLTPVLSPVLQNLVNNMVHVEGGTFTMGATSEQGKDAYGIEKPTRQVTLKSFSIGKYQVTQEEWEAVMGKNPSSFKYAERLPVENVNWDDCQTFIRKLNAMTGKQFRLPTEAEWEYAARGGNRSRGYKYSGSNYFFDVAWYKRSSNRWTNPVGKKRANELGLYDMSGNVWEWCQDWYGKYNSSAQTNPTGPFSGSYRIHRGGGWRTDERNCRVSSRRRSLPVNKFDDLGLRLAL